MKPDDSDSEPEMWLTDADWQSDLRRYALPPQPAVDAPFAAMPATLVDYYAQMERNRRTRLPEADSNATLFISGRGRGVRDRIIRPGDDFVSHPSDDIELVRQIREASGPGYSNQLIEKAIQAQAGQGSSECLFKFLPSSPSSKASSKSDRD